MVAGAGRPAGWHRPIDFPSLSITCADLAAAIAEGPGLVVLVGPAESGKSVTVVALAARIADWSINIRRADHEILPGTIVDVVDPVVDELLDDLVKPAPAPTRVRVLAARPDQLQPILDRSPGVRVVHVRPLTPGDRRAFIEARRTQRRRSGDARLNRAMAVLAGYNITTPGALDRMIDQIFELAPAKLWPDRAEGAALFESLASARERTLEPDAATHSTALTGAMGATARSPLSRSGRVSAAFGEGRLPAPATTDPAGRTIQARPGYPQRRGKTFDAPSWDMMQSSVHEIVHHVPARRRRHVRKIAACAAVVLVAAGDIAANKLWTHPEAEPPQHLASLATPIQTADLPTPGTISMAVPTQLPPAPAPPDSVEDQVAAVPLAAEPEHPDASLALANPARAAPVVEANPATTVAPATSGPNPAPVVRASVPLSPAPALALPPVPVASEGLALAAPGSTEPPSAAPPSTARPQLGRSPAAQQAAPAAAAAAVTAPPTRTPRIQQPAPVPASGENAVHLLRLGKALMSIGQQADGERLLAAAAELGNAEAEALLSVRSRARPTKSASPRLHNAR